MPVIQVLIGDGFYNLLAELVCPMRVWMDLIVHA